MKLGTFLLAMMEPLIAKILVTLGFSLITITGVDASLNQIKLLISAYITGAGPVLDFAMYVWIGKGIGIVFGACATKLMLWQIQNATKILGRNPG